MKKAFTLIELIFVIVIIGLLAAVAVPKFLNLKQNAQAASVVKTATDAAQQAVETAINWRDMEGRKYVQNASDTNDSEFNLSKLIKLNGKGWSYEGESTQIPNGDGYTYIDAVNNKNVAYVEMNSTVVNYEINCSAFDDATTQSKCKALIGDKDDINVTVSW